MDAPIKPGDGNPRNIRRRRRKANPQYKTAVNPLAGLSTQRMVMLWHAMPPAERPKKTAWQSKMEPGSYVRAPNWKPSGRYRNVDGKLRRVK